MLSVEDAGIIFPIAYSYLYGVTEFFCVPMRENEPIADFKSVAICPSAAARGGSGDAGASKAICKIANGPSLAAPCQACEGAWLYASGKVEHICGDTLSFWEHDRLPDCNNMLLGAIFRSEDGA